MATVIEDFRTFSITLNENKNVTDTVYCPVFIQQFEKNFNITEELLDLQVKICVSGNRR